MVVWFHGLFIPSNRSARLILSLTLADNGVSYILTLYNATSTNVTLDNNNYVEIFLVGITLTST